MINYYLLTKPGIILGNLITFAAGFLLASKGIINFQLFFSALVGLGFVIASACVFNCYIDRKRDKKMKRTKNRPLAEGRVSEKKAIAFAIFLGVVGGLILFFHVGFFALVSAWIGFFVYVFLYSMWKSRTIYGTAIGSVAGAMPPIVGYCAASNRLDIGAIALFTMMVLWQMPHFFAIALLHREDYEMAEIPILPITKGAWRAKVHMILYIFGFILAAAMLTFFGYTGYLYLFTTSSVGLIWLLLSAQGFKSSDDRLWGLHMFRASLFTIIAVCLAISFDIVT